MADPISGEPERVQVLRAALLTMSEDDATQLVRRLDRAELLAVRRAAGLLLDATSAALIGRGGR